MTAQQVVEFYQQLGFLNFTSSESVLARYEQEMGDPFDSRRPWDDVFLLSLDEARVWAGDPEADVDAGNRVYCEVVAEWSRISSGIFEPSQIEEYWHSDEGPIVVSFLLGDERFGLDPIYGDGYLDLSILLQINSLVSPSGKRFVCASDVNYAVVFVCDELTRNKLEQVRRFPFCF